jgi:hypothetical protein
MADTSLPHFSSTIRLRDCEQEALFICLTMGIAALEFKKSAHTMLEPRINVALIEIQQIYCNVTGEQIASNSEINYAGLIKRTLEVFEQNHDASSIFLCRFLKIIKNLMKNIVIVFSITHPHRDIYTYSFSENYDKLTGFLHKIDSVLLSDRYNRGG